MQFWDTVISTMLMGTEKKTVKPDELPASLAEAYAVIEQNTSIDREEKFLQLAALAFSYRQSGSQPSAYEGELTEAPEESIPYCSGRALQVLKDILAEGTTSLLIEWLQECEHAQRIVTPELIPPLFDEANRNKKLQPTIAIVCGNRGEWLGRFNPLWRFSSFESDEEVWKTGTLEQRKNVLLSIRKQDPARATEWLKQTWSQEDANTRAALLETLSGDTSVTDLPFLESLVDDKSRKVKELARKLLKQVPGSSIVQLHQDFLSKTVQLIKESTIPGILSKKVLQFNLPTDTDEVLFKTGIDKLSPDKSLSDTEYIFYQLIQSVPPSFWEMQLQADPEAIINIFQKDATGQKMIPALVIAITGFRDRKWAKAFRQHSTTFYLDIIPLLEEDEQDTYSESFFDKHAQAILFYAAGRTKEWSHGLAMKILRYTAKNPYQYTRSFYNQHIHLIPVSATAELEKCTPAERHLQEYWSGIQDHILRLLTLRYHTLNAFKE